MSSPQDDLSTNEYGIKLVGGTATHPELYIKYLDPEKKGYDLLKVKDRVIGLNGISMAGHTWDEAMFRIQGSDEKLTVTVQRHITLRPYEVSRLFKQKEQQKAEYAKRKADEKEAKRRAKAEKELRRQQQQQQQQQQEINQAQGDHAALPNGITEQNKISNNKSSIANKYGARGSLKMSTKNSNIPQKIQVKTPESTDYNETTQTTTESATEETPYQKLHKPNEIRPVNSLLDTQGNNTEEDDENVNDNNDNNDPTNRSTSPDQKSSNVSRSKSLGIKSDVPKAKLKLTHNNSISTNPPAASKYKFFGGTTEKCTKCQKTVYHAERCIGPQGDIYHKLCLSCAICRTNLSTGNWCDHDRVPYCKSCHMKQFGPHGTLGRF